MKVLEKLYYGKIIMHGHPIRQGSDFEESLKFLNENDDKFTEILSDEQKLLFEKYKESDIKMLSIAEKDSFITGFSLGLRIAVESMSNKDYLYEY